MTAQEYETLFPDIPDDYPRLVYQAIYNLTGREDISDKIKRFRGSYTQLDVWHALRSAYISLKADNKEFKYKYNFKDYKIFSVYEMVEHLREITASSPDLARLDQDRFTWEHLADCEHHWQIYLIMVNSFLEAVQGMNFSKRFNGRLEKFFKKILLALENLLAKLIEELGVEIDKYSIELSPEQSFMLSQQAEEWGEEKTARFIAEYIVPLVKVDDDKLDLTTEKLLALLAQFESLSHRN